MNQAMVDKIVQAMLYEGYNLYPYRPSVKNRCRWTFGGLYPRSYSEALEGTDPWSMQVQCLVQGESGASLEVKLRFLHLVQRTIRVLPFPCDEAPEEEVPHYKAVDSFLLNGTRHQTWQEAVENEVTIGPLPLATILSRPEIKSFTIPAGHTLEPLRGPDGQVAAVAVRAREALEGSAEVFAEPLEESAFRLTVRVANRTSLENAGTCSRDVALMRTLVAMHALVMVKEGKFFSLTDPPEALRQAAAACQNRGVWPVLVARRRAGRDAGVADHPL